MTGPAGTGPLSAAELDQLEATLLPALERHHLRLLAHSLRTLQQVAAASPAPGPGVLPDQAAIEGWLHRQAGLTEDDDFRLALSQQLLTTGRQLEQLASGVGRRSALELGLDDLIGWATRQADQRLSQG